MKMMDNLITTESMLRPLSTQRLILFCYFMSMYVSLTSSYVIISLELKRYTNPTHQQLDKACCEWICWDFLDLGVCDNYISLCVDDIESVSDSMYTCPYYQVDNFHEGDDDFHFPFNVGSYHSNPIVFEVANYTGSFRLKLDVWDKDISLFGLNCDDHVDFYNEKVFISPSSSANSASIQFQTMNGSGSSRSTIEVKAYCADNYYGIDCSVYCKACDNDDEGHYTCDPSTGNKTCLPGYNGTLCKIDINECESSPCQNGCTCRNYPNYFKCECAEGNQVTYAILCIILSKAAVILVVALAFIFRRRHYVRSDNLESDIEHKPLLSSTSVNEANLDCTRSADMLNTLNSNLQDSQSHS